VWLRRAFGGKRELELIDDLVHGEDNLAMRNIKEKRLKGYDIRVMKNN